MALYLVDEGTIAVGLLSGVLLVGLLGVAALGWYVVRADALNRHAERDLLAPDGHGIVHRISEGETSVVDESVPAEATAVEPGPSTDAPASDPRHRKGH